MGPDGYEPGSGGDGGSGHIEDPTKRVQKKLLASLADAAGAKVIPKDLVTLQDALPGRVTQSPSPIFDALTSERNVAEQPVSQNSPQNSPQERTSPAPRTIDEQMWDSGSGGTRQERATPVQETPVDQVGSSVVSTPTPEDERSLLQKGIQHAREIMAREIEKWNALPEAERTTKIENILTRFEKFTENGVLKREGKDPKLGLFHKLAAQIAEIIEKDVIPGIEPFTKGVLILAFTDMAMPPRISILLTKYIGDLLSGRIENNAQRAVDRLRTFSGAIENIQAVTPAEEGFLGRLKQRVNEELEKLKSVETGEENVAASDGTTAEDEASNPDGSAEDAASTLGDETVGDDPEEGAEAEVVAGDGEDDSSESAKSQKDDESREVEGIPQEVIDAYIKYLSYGSSGPDAQERALAYFKTNPNAIEYSKEVIRMSREYGEEALFAFADNDINVLKKILSALNLEPSRYALSRSWVLWHVAKLRYLKSNPNIQSGMPNADQYNPEDPLQAISPDDLSHEELDKSVDANREMVFVMLGWELYNALHGNEDKVEELLDPAADPYEQEELMDLIREEIEEGKNSLSSYKLRRLGELAVDNFILSAPADSAETSSGGGDGSGTRRPRPPEGGRNTERENSSERSGYYMERRDVGAEIRQARHEINIQLSQTMNAEARRKIITGEGNREHNEKLDEMAMAQVSRELGKEIRSIVISEQQRFYLEYDVREHDECEVHGEHTTSIVVQLNRAGLLGNFTPPEVDIIRSFDPRFLHPPGTPELFQEKFKNMFDEATAEVPGGTEAQIQARFQGKYENYKGTLNRVMYTLIAGKVEGEDATASDTSAKLAKIIQTRLAELKTITKHPSFEATEMVPNSTRINIRKREVVSSIAEITRPEALYGGRSMYVEYDEAVPLAKALSEDLIPTLEKIEKSVGYANKLRNTTHSSADMNAVAEAARSADMAAIPEAIAQNEYLKFAMQEYIKALAQVIAQESHIPYSNFGELKPSGLEYAEELTIEGLMLRFPMIPPAFSEEIIVEKADGIIQESKNKAIKRAKAVARAMAISANTNAEEAEARAQNEVESKAAASYKHDIQVEMQKQRNNEARRKKRYENDLELAVKVASGLHKGVGEYWSVLDACIGNDVLTAHMVKEGDSTVGRVRTFADSNSYIINKIMEMKPVEGSRFGKEAGYALMAVPAARYLGERMDTSKRSWQNKFLFKNGIVDLTKVAAGVRDWDPNPNGEPPRRRRFFRLREHERLQRKPDQTSHAELLLRAREMSEADRNGMTPELAEFYREYMGVTQLMHKIPGDIPRSGGWRVDNNDSIDQKFIQAYTLEARQAGIAGRAMHEHVMGRLKELGGDRMIIHYIGKNLESLMEYDRDSKRVLDRYKATKKRVSDAIANGSFAAQDEKSQDEIDLEIMTPIFNRAKDTARTLFIRKYVIKPRLEQNPEMVLLYERRGFTPKGEKLIRRQLIDLMQARAGDNGEINGSIESTNRNFAIMYQCLPAFEVAIRALHNAPGETESEYKQRIQAYFKDKIDSSHPVRIEKEGEPAVEYSPLKAVLNGESIDDKTENMMSLFEVYRAKVTELGQSEALAQRFAEQVVLETGNVGSLLTSPGGFDYSKMQFDGKSTVKSANSGIEGNLALKKTMGKLESTLLGLYLTGLDSVKKVDDYKKIVDAIHADLNEYANAMSANLDEANVFYARLAQIAVISLREPVPGDRIPSVWFSGDTTQTGHGLNAEQRYYLLKALLRTRGIPEKIAVLNPDELSPLTQSQQQDLRNLESEPADDGHIIGVTPAAKIWSALTGQTKLKSSRDKKAKRLAKRGYFKGGTKFYATDMSLVLAGVDVTASSLEIKEANARRQKDLAEAAAK